jgi:Tfp pilus assembly protein PilW
VSGGRRPTDRGASVVELSVAMTVGALLLAASTMVVVGALRTVRVVHASTSTVADARLAAEAITRTLRVAWKPADADAAVLAAGPTGVRFWALLNRTGAPTAVEPPPTLVEYAYDGTCLTESQTRGGSTVQTCLLRTAVAPVFTYYASAASAADGTPLAPLPSAPSVAAADLTAIRSVQLELTVRTPGSADATALPVLTRVTLQNLQGG